MLNNKIIELKLEGNLLVGKEKLRILCEEL
jgi:hypothetical protein